ncbi:MAG: XdhC family protein [Pseudomonadota bacterium]
MSPAELLDTDLAEAAQALRARDEPFAFATIVRTAGATAAKPGAKAILSADGTIVEGWLGGGCARGAVKRATVEAFASGQPQLVSVTPEEFLAERGLTSGDTEDGVTYARNGCPSKGTVDIFIEPCLPMPELVIFGESPVARALSDLAPQFHWSVTQTTDDAALAATNRQRYIVVASQGVGDLAALKATLAGDAVYISFVGSKRKFAALSEKLVSDGISTSRVAAIKAPAGLDINAVTPEEIALSILAELVQLRRRRLRSENG